SLSAVASAPRASGIVAQGRERRGGIGLLWIAEQAHAQLGFLQRLLAATVEAHATLVGGERFLEAQVAVLHLLDQLLERVERGFEVGDRRGGVGGVGRAGHACKSTPSPASAAARRGPAASRAAPRKAAGRPRPAAV